jgi:hypothetical protein
VVATFQSPARAVPPATRDKNVPRNRRHLYRWNNWNLTAKSDEFKKTDAQTIEFRAPVKPDEEKTVTYTVHYSW